MLSSSVWVLVVGFRGGMQFLEIVSERLFDMVIFVACVSMRLVGAMGGDGESVKVMLFLTYVSRPPPDLDCLSFLVAEYPGKCGVLF